MRIIIHDLEQTEFTEIFRETKQDDIVISDNGTIKNCIGCFGCWIKTPGKCVIQDEYQRMGELLAHSDEVIILSRCCYGSYSPFAKNVLDRSISYILPYFTNVKGEMHHKKRYKTHFKMKVCFYGADITENEKVTAKQLVQAEAINLYVLDYKIDFGQKPDEFKEVLA